MVTVFTPTYNRARELARLYDSLLSQTNKDFEWLIVDDGSTDDTKQVVEEFISQNCINIKYTFQHNNGKMKAHNRGVKIANGDIFVCVDADDWLTEDAVEIILKNSSGLENDDVGGMMFLNFYGESEKIVGSKFPFETGIYSYFDIYGKLGVTGDKTIIFLTDVIKNYPFPEIDDEKFVPEALVYNRIAKEYKLFCVNTAIKRVEYLADGYSNNYFNLVKRNPKGNTLYFKEKYEFEPSLYNVYGYILFSIYSKYTLKEMLENHKAKIKILALYLPTFIISKIKGKNK